jgi:hypothetical protein
MALVSLVYVSFASHPLSDDDLRNILAKAREKNKKLDITGMLLYRDGFFIQALEGEKEAVDALFEVISRDERHRNVLLVYETEIEERTFQTWAMGFNPLNSLTAEEEGFFDFLNGTPTADIFTEKPSRAKALLEHFKNRTYF